MRVLGSGRRRPRSWSAILAPVFAGTAGAFVGTIDHETVPVDRPRAALLADLDGDGDADVVAIDRRGRLGVVVNAEAGFGAFEPVDGASPSGKAARLAAGDVDRDGDVDLVVCARGGRRKLGGRACRLLLGRPAAGGFFADATESAGLPPTGPRSIPVLADFDGDLDVLLFPERRRGASAILRNQLDGSAFAFAAIEGANRCRRAPCGALRSWTPRAAAPPSGWSSAGAPRPFSSGTRRPAATATVGGTAACRNGRREAVSPPPATSTATATATSSPGPAEPSSSSGSGRTGRSTWRRWTRRDPRRPHSRSRTWIAMTGATSTSRARRARASSC
jgi:hypothetical protein